MTNTRLARAIRNAGATIPLLLLPGIALAQQAAPAGGGIEEVFVTAQKRSENLQETPIAISAYSSEDLLDLGVDDMYSFISQTPSIYGAQYPLANSILTVYMRGQGNNDPMQITKDGSIGIYENGIYNSRPQAVLFDLADVERVEVLRGPQGTLYGRNTTGGAMNIVSKAPTGEFGVRQLLSVGERQQYRSVTTVDLPALGNLRGKVTVAAANDDGYVRNSGASNNFNESKHLGARVALLWNATDTLTFDYGFTSADIDTTPNYLSNPSLNGYTLIPGVTYRSTKYRSYRPVDLPESPNDISDHTLTVTWEALPELTIKSLTGARDLDMTNYQDTMEAYGIGLPVNDYLNSEQFSQELQFIGSFGERIEYVAGLYYFDEDADHLQTNEFIIPGQPTSSSYRFVDAKSESRAAYAQVTWTPPVLEDRLDVTLGARYTEDERKATRDYSISGFVIDDGTTNDKDFSRSTPSLTVAYSFSDDLSAYAKVASGYRAGGSSESAADFSRTFGPETLETYEIGVKAEWLDKRLRTNLALFSSDYQDIQLDVTPDPDNITITQTINAGEAVINGLELDLTAAISDDLTLTLGYAYLDAEVEDVSIPGSPINEDYFVIPYAPENSVNVAIDYTFYRFASGSLAAKLNYAWKGDAYNTSGAGDKVPGNHFYRNEDYGLLDGRLTVEFQPDSMANPVRVSLWGSNLLDIDDPVYTSAIGSSNTGYTSSAYFWAEPRTFGADLEFSF